MPKITPGTLGAVAAVALLLALPPILDLVGAPFYVDVATRIAIFAIAAVALDLVLGYGGMVSFGHAAFIGVGAYTVGILSTHASNGTLLFDGALPISGTHSALIAWPLAVLASALAAFFIGLVSLRTRGVYFIMITLAFAQMIYFFFVSLETYGGDDGLSLWERSSLLGLDLYDSTVFYYLVIFILIAVLVFCRRLVGARFGRVIVGARENERRMNAIGFPTYRYKLVCFTISGAIAGLAGALLANQTEFVSPSLLHWTRSGELIVMVVLGGMGTLLGPVVGAIFFLLLEDVLSELTQHWMIIFGPLLILVVLFANRGLLGLLRRGTGNDTR